MAAMAFSIVTTGVFLYPLISGLIKPDSAAETSVGITLGSTGIQHDNKNMEGNIPNIAVYAEDGTEIGRAHGSSKKSWSAGSTNFVHINPDKEMNGRQATYVSISNGGNNAICISAVSVSWPDNTGSKVWLGDIGQNCSTSNGPFWSNSVTQTGSDPQFQSKCIWLDGDDTNGIPTQGFSLHIVDFGRTDGAYTRDGALTTNPVADQWNDNNDLLCKAPGRMSFYTHYGPDDYPTIYQPPLEYNENGTDKDLNTVLNGGCDDNPELIVSPCTPHKSRKSKRIAQGTQHLRASNSSFPMANTIVHSNSIAHSAEELCLHPGSRGPSFVSYYEGKFCDMVTRIIWPLCSHTIHSRCFDSYLNKLILNQKGWNSTHIDLLVPKGNGSWERVVHW